MEQKSTLFSSAESQDSIKIGQVVLHDFIFKYTMGLNALMRPLQQYKNPEFSIESPTFNEIVPNSER